ncbi:MAG: hypothetical protein KatS3mg077_2028 [Candidatus Binatia bacterium]|nr:MAG: hypothetical protein KatS3mg077_2028 [Candidatus Binatia bacterium]
MRGSGASNYVPALGFRWLTPYYDVVVGLTTRERAFKRALIGQADIRPGQRVLDLGCGTGTLSVWIAQSCPEADIVGVDGDREALAIAKEKAERAGVAVRFDEAMADELPYPDEHFDRVLASLFFHHLSRSAKERTIREVCRVLRPGGRLHVADWGRPSNALMRMLFFPVQLLDGFSNTQDHVEGRLPELLRSGGFVDVAEGPTFATMLGTMALYSAAKPLRFAAR